MVQKTLEVIDMDCRLETRMALLEQALNEMRHSRKNDKTVIDALENELDYVHRQFEAFRAKTYTVVTFAIVLGPFFVWVLDNVR